MPFPSASLTTNSWANNSRVGISGSGGGSNVRFKTHEPSSTAAYSPPRPPRAIEPIPHFMRDSTDKEDSDFLAYLSTFQEKLNRPL
jgi:hypothetical protein